MSFKTATQAQRDAIVLGVRKASSALEPSINSRSLRGVRNDYTDAQIDTILGDLRTALVAAGYTT